MANIGSIDDIQNLFKETIAEFMENGLEAELEDKLSYSRYGYRNKATDGSRIRSAHLRERQQRPLEGNCAVVFLDAIHCHVRSEGQIVKKAVYIAIGIELDGRKDVLGM